MTAHRLALWTLLVALLTLLSAARASAELNLEIEDHGVSITGLTPGSSAAILSVWRHRVLDAFTRVTRISELIADDDGDGTVRLDLEAAVPVGSPWVVVDSATGAMTVQAPAGYPVKSFTLDDRRVHKSLGRFVIDRGDLEVLAVRPSVGAWHLPLSDGGPEDGDGEQNGAIAATLLSLQPLGFSPPIPLDGFVEGDVLAAIDVRRMELVTVRIAR